MVPLSLRDAPPALRALAVAGGAATALPVARLAEAALGPDGARALLLLVGPLAAAHALVAFASALRALHEPQWAPRRVPPVALGYRDAGAWRHDAARVDAAREAAALARDPLDLFVLSAMPPYGAHTRHLHEALARDAARYWYVAPDHPAGAPGRPAAPADLEVCVRQLAAALRGAPAQPALAALSRSCHVALSAALAVLDGGGAEGRLACHLHLIAPDATHPAFLSLWRRAAAYARVGRLFATVHASVHDACARPLLEAADARHENLSLLLYTVHVGDATVAREPDHFHTQVCALAHLRGRAHAHLALDAGALGGDVDETAERRATTCEVRVEEA